MGFVSASTGYPRCRLLYVHKEKEAKEEEEEEEEVQRGAVWL